MHKRPLVDLKLRYNSESTLGVMGNLARIDAPTYARFSSVVARDTLRVCRREQVFERSFFSLAPHRVFHEEQGLILTLQQPPR